jgi:hypothetical protein
MAKVTVPTFSSLTNESSFLSQLNTAMASLVAAIELTLSRNGQSPNTLTADLDMNSQRIINLPAPTTDNEPVRLVDVATGIRGPTGATGAAGTDGGPLANGDYGDIVVTSSGAAINIDSAVLTTAGRALIDDADAAAQRTTLGLGGAAILAVGTTAGTVAAGDDSRFTAYKSNDQSGATYTFAISDAGTLVRQTAAGAHTYTINPNATTAIPVRSVIVLRNAIGAGALSIVRGAGVSLYINGSTTSAAGTLAAGGVVTLVQEAVDTWFATGVGIS